MNGSSRSRIIGAFLVGFAIVAVSYAVNFFGQPTIASDQPAIVSEAPLRSTIEVTDSNQDGVEDWQEEFVDIAPVILNNSTDDDYELPETTTGQAALALIQRAVLAKTHGTFGDSQEEMVKKTADSIKAQSGDKIYSIKDIIISKDTADQDIRNYGNALANAILDNDVQGLRDKLLILKNVLESPTPSQEDLDELKVIADIYLNTRNATLNIPVPKTFVKEHLDLINVYNAYHQDIVAMYKVHEDPLLTLVRLKRYEDDATGLRLALQNMYFALKKHERVFEEGDSAAFFNVFDPNFEFDTLQ